MKWLIVLSFLATSSFAFESVPLFMWGNTGKKQDNIPALSHFSSDEFTRILASKTTSDEHTPIVAFMESQLTVEDFKTCHNCFTKLQSRAPKIYFPAIDAPLSALTALSRLQSVETKYLAISGATLKSAADEVIASLKDGTSKNFLITFIDAGLADHDQLIDEFQRLVDNGQVLYVYTGESSGQMRARIARQVDTKNASTTVQITSRQEMVNNGIFFNVEGRVLIHIKGLYAISGEEETAINITAIPTVTTTETGAIVATLTGNVADQVITMEFVSQDGYWRVNKMTLNDVELYMGQSNSIGTPLGFSYVCNDNLVYHTVSDNTPTWTPVPVLRWKGLQIEPDFTAQSTRTAFSDSWDCVGFTSSGILGGLFVVVMLFIILGIGICCMMGINTMDRFDDPKGPTITVQVGES